MTNGIDPQIQQWRKDGGYLPAFLRDFHDQKDFFKALHEAVDVGGHEYVKDISWMEGQCYTIDILLWWLARFGYTLQKSRAKLPFEDLEDTQRRLRERRDAAASAAIGSIFRSNGC